MTIAALLVAGTAWAGTVWAGPFVPEPLPAPAQDPARDDDLSRPGVGRAPSDRSRELPFLRVGLYAGYSSLYGRVEKENTALGPGSGGDRVSLLGDLDLPRYLWSGRVEVAIDLTQGAEWGRLRAVGEYFRTDGQKLLTSQFRHDGAIFPAGAVVRSVFSMALLDLEGFWHPARRRGSRELPESVGIILGARLVQFRHRIRSGSLLHSETTNGVWPRLGIGFERLFGEFVLFWGSAVAGGMYYGEGNGRFAAASFDFEGGIGVVPIPYAEIRLGWRYQTMGIWWTANHDLERVTIGRAGMIFGLVVRTP